MFDENRVKIYVGVSFTLGILLTLGFKDVYPDLERRYRRRRQGTSTWSDPLGRFRGSSEKVTLQDNEANPSLAGSPSVEIPEGIESTIGNTPLFRIKSLSDATGCDILGKAEFLNGAGQSPKDRVALNIILTAEAAGLLTPHSGDTIYEGTVGSTGISLATLCRARGYKAHICMPSDVAVEKSDLLEKLGAIVEKVRPAPITDRNHFVNLAKRRAEEHTKDSAKPGRGIFADQFENEANWKAHFEATGPELYAQTSHKIDALVLGAGTGGTISGLALYLKPLLPNLHICLADPQGSGLYNKITHNVLFSPTEREGTRRRHQTDTLVEGIGCNRLTSNFAAGMHHITTALSITDSQALAMSRYLIEKDGLFIGSSSAVNCVAAVRTAQKLGPGKRVVTILCDSGTRHLSKFWREAGNVGGKDDVTLDDVLAGRWGQGEGEGGEVEGKKEEEVEKRVSSDELRLPIY
ncbi:PALP-domain-containing protein [Venturia nashicola]|uniref:Cysteine synthase 2 n=1 Tax=Venturia nashicola TaxID=86259 RepID=A0A4Z1NRB7_9PEZI|nr:PALP-domain-containing protein [Venturia nashicola]TLD25794.1 PALP-domain-containing protein [Venturia nashicola]